MSERDIFTAAREMTDPAARGAYLDGACGADTGLRSRVEALLRAHEQPDSLLDHPAVAPPDPGSAATRTLGGAGGTATADEALTFLAPPTRPDALGRLGHYEVLQVLGQGGFGIVFRAFDEMLQRVVALKVMAPLLAATSPARKRFLREARSSAQVRHDNVVQVYEVAEQPLPYLAMEFIPGETLQQRLDRVGPLDVPEVLRIGRQIAEGLAAAHATDLIHRDIKPGNVLLEGGHQKVKITDFGLARTADDASISQSGIIAGTPMYMAPEQAEGKTLDQRADLFSLGSVLYQMVAGRPPFRANSAVAVLKRVAEDKPRAIREIIPETPPWLCDIIAKLHAKNPDDRYQSARAVADVLADCEAQLKANARLKDYSRIPRGKPRHSGRRKWVAAAAAVLLPLMALTATELTGITHFLHKQPGVVPSSNPAPSPDDSDSEGWVQLFNGKDLSGWKKDPGHPGFWHVDEDGHLVGAGPVDYAFLGTVRDDFENFQLRVEAMVDTPESDSGVFFRVPFLIEPGSGFAEININPARPGQQTGSLLVEKFGWKNAGKGVWYPAATGLTKPKEWFILEIIARGDHVVTKVNGKLALDTEAPTANRRGHIFLQQCGGQTTVRFKKIEIKDLPPAGVRTESGAKDKPAVPAVAPTKYGDPEYTNTLGMKFKLIPAGKFTMGSPKEEIDRCLKQPGPYKGNVPTEGPEHSVEITRPFYLGATEVTVGQFRQFVDEEAYQVGDGRWRNPAFDQTDQHPVVFVSWNNAVDFCKWLSKKEGKEYRLPTEAEWEYSCRAGKAGSRYGFGDDDAQLKDYAWFEQNSGGGTHPVGKKKPNAWGLYDMHGNAWEWCQDNYDRDYYKNSPVKDPPGGAGGARVGRGGGWLHGPVLCRSAFRGYLGPDDHVGAGFRVLLVPPAAGVGTESGAKDKPASPAIAPFTDADVQRIAALPAAEQVEEVRKELKRRNPGFDGKMETKIEGGVVTEFQIVTDKVTDIAPIRVFDALRVLVCSGTTDNGKPNGLLEDLTPLQGMNLAGLTHLGLWNTKVSDAEMAHFKDCKNLKFLYVGRTQIDDAGLTQLKGMPLKALAINDTGITDLAPLQGMPLEFITFTPKNITRGLDTLRDMKSLKTIGIAWQQTWPAAEFWERYDKGEFK